MFKLSKRRERELELGFRVRELENIICPLEQHEFIAISKSYQPDNGGSGYMIVKYICKKCLKKTQKIE